MKTIVLRLEGPFQAWSSQGKFGIRDTEREPTKSGVIGLVGAALGMSRDDEARLAQLAELTMAVRVDRPGSLLRDYHTAGGGTFRGKAYAVYGAKDCVPTQRYYLADASFVVALSGEDALIEEIAAALSDPRWPLFLGRRSCVPSEPILIGISGADAPSAVKAAPRSSRCSDAASSRIVVETSSPEGAEIRYDVPRSFREGARAYGQRFVRSEWFEKVAVESAS